MEQIIWKIRYYIRHYHLGFSIITGIAAVIIYTKTAYDLSHSYSSDMLIPDSFYLHGTAFLLFAIWVVITAIPVMHIYYADKTGGRSFLRDRRQYNRSYGELISYYKDADPYKMKGSDLPMINWKHSEGIIFGKTGNRLIRRSAFENGGDGVNIALTGLPGSGKTAAGLIPTALVYGGSILAIDIKGDILKATKHRRRIKLFAPDDPASSCHYNPLAGVSEMNSLEKRIFLEQIASVLIPEERDKYWYKTGRSIFIGVALYVISQDTNATLPEIAHAILQGDAVYWIKAIKDSECLDAKDYTDGLYGSNETNLAGAYGSLAEAVRPFSFGSMAELLRDHEDALSSATLDEGYDIYIEIPQDKIKVYSPISTILIQNFMTAFMQRPDKAVGVNRRPVLFMLDEFPQLRFEFDTLSAALSTLRSKSVSVMIAQQSVAQLINRYSEDCCREIIDTCSYLSIMSAQDPKSRQFFQDLIGTKKDLKTTTSGNYSDGFHSSSSHGSQESREPIFREGDFSNLGDKVIIYALGKYILAEKVYWFK